MLKTFLVAPIMVLMLWGCAADPETARQRYVVMEYAVEGAANAGTKAVARGVLEPGSSGARTYLDGLDTAGVALDEANVQLKGGNFDNVLSWLQVSSAALVSIRSLLDEVSSDE